MWSLKKRKKDTAEKKRDRVQGHGALLEPIPALIRRKAGYTLESQRPPPQLRGWMLSTSEDVRGTISNTARKGAFNTLL
ncbi:hypothetical protein AOLI_G00122010 [Acnodon oligacanthus]